MINDKLTDDRKLQLSELLHQKRRDIESDTLGT